MSKKYDTDKFNTFLKFLLDGTGLFTREQWAEYLDVQMTHIDGWPIPPKPDMLRSILRVLRESDGIEGVEEALAEVEHLPLVEISNYDRSQWQGVSTLSEYLCLPLMDGLRRAMTGLSLDQRERIIQSAADAAYKLKE